MEEEKDAFYVLRKGDVIGIYKSLSDCQAQVSSSVCDPPVSVYKGYSFPKETEEYLASRGLKNALYSMHAVDAKDNLFGNLVPCPFQESKPFQHATSPLNRHQVLSTGTKTFQQATISAMCFQQAQHRVTHTMISTDMMEPDSLAFSADKSPQRTSSRKVSTDMVNELQPNGLAFSVDKSLQKISNRKRSTDMVNELVEIGSSSLAVEQSKKHFKPGNSIVEHPSHDRACILEFDGASKGNPGKAGAGAILRAEDGRVISRLRQGLGLATNNVAEYQALILGMKHALKKGFKHIRVQGDSNLVCMQVNGVWQTKNENMANLCKEAKLLKDKFLSFKISHVLREFNSAADEQANLGVGLCNGQVQEECGEPY